MKFPHRDESFLGMNIFYGVRLFRTVRHFPLSSLVNRLGLRLKRRIYGWMPGLKNPPEMSGPQAVMFAEALDYPAWQTLRGQAADLRESLLRQNMGVILNESFSLPADSEQLEMLMLGKSPLWRENYGYLAFLRPLMDRAFLTENPEAADLLKRQLRLWMAVPFEEAGWSVYGVARRLLTCCQLVSVSDALGDDFDRAAFLNWTYRQAVYLGRMPETDVGGNHLICNLHALLAMACLFASCPDPAVRRQVRQWQGYLRSHLVPVFQAQLLPDGLHFERTPMYHAWVLLDLLGCLRLLARDWPDFDRAPLEAMAHEMLSAMAQLVHTSGHIPLFGDSSLLQTPTLAEITAYARSAGIEPDEVEMPPLTYFSVAGLAVFRTRQPEASLIIKSGELGPRRLPAHQHGDIGSFELRVGGQPMIADSGVSEYEPGLVRDYFRSAAAHNTLWVPGEDQGEFWGSFRLAEYPDHQGATLEADSVGARLGLSYENHNHHYGHKRELFFLNQAHPFWVVQDWVTHLYPTGRPCYSLLHIHPDVPVRQAGEAIFEVGDRLLVIPYGFRKLESSDLSPWREQLNLYSDGFNRARPGRLIAMQPRMPDGFGWILVPYTGEKPTCKRHGEAVELVFEEPGTPAEAILITWEAEGLRIGARPPVA